MTLRLLRKALNIIIPIFLGGAILYWMYRNFDFDSVRQVLLSEMNWWWMLLSMPSVCWRRCSAHGDGNRLSNRWMNIPVQTIV